MDSIEARFSEEALIQLDNADREPNDFLFMLNKNEVDLSGKTRKTKLSICTVYVNKDGIIDGIIFDRPPKSLDNSTTFVKTAHCKQRQKQRNISNASMDNALNTPRLKGGKHTGKDGTTVVVKTPRRKKQILATTYKK